MHISITNSEIDRKWIFYGWYTLREGIKTPVNSLSLQYSVLPMGFLPDSHLHKLMMNFSMMHRTTQNVRGEHKNVKFSRKAIELSQYSSVSSWYLPWIQSTWLISIICIFMTCTLPFHAFYLWIFQLWKCKLQQIWIDFTTQNWLMVRFEKCQSCFSL